MAAARKKKPLEPEVEAKVNALLGAVKRPRTLQDLHAALVALPRSGEAGAEAMRRLQPPFKTFGGATPGEDEEAISWDKTHLLVVGDEGLEGARLVPRRGAAPEVPRSQERPRASNDEEEAAEEPPAEEQSPEAPAPPGVDPEALRQALAEACAAHRVETRRIEVAAASKGGRVTFVPKDGPKMVLVLDAETWSQDIPTLVAGLIDAITVGE